MKNSNKSKTLLFVLMYFFAAKSTYANTVHPVLYKMHECRMAFYQSEKYHSIKKKNKKLTEEEKDYIQKIENISNYSYHEYVIYALGLEDRVKKMMEQQTKHWPTITEVQKQELRVGVVMMVSSGQARGVETRYKEKIEAAFPNIFRPRHLWSPEDHRAYSDWHNAQAIACEADLDDMNALTGEFSLNSKNQKNRYDEFYQLMVLNVKDPLEQLKALVVFERDHNVKKISGFDINKDDRRKKYNDLLKKNEKYLMATIDSIISIDRAEKFIQQYRYFEKPISAIEKKILNASSDKLKKLAPLYRYDIIANNDSVYRFNGHVLSEILKGNTEAVRTMERYTRDKKNPVGLQALMLQYLFFYKFHNKPCLGENAQELTVSGKSADVVLANGLGQETFRIDGAKFSATYVLPERLIGVCKKICTSGMSGNHKTKLPFGGFLKNESCQSPARKRFEQNLIDIYESVY